MSTQKQVNGRFATWREAVVKEVRERPMAYVVLGSFLVAGPILTPLLFPEAPAGVGLVGGLAFGAFCALSAVPQKFL